MQAPVTLPDLGLDAGEPLAVSVWLASPGDFVFEGDRLVEVLTTAATFDVPAPATGRLASVVAYPDDRLETGQLLGWLDVADSDPLTRRKHG